MHPVSRRESLKRIGAAAATFGSTAALAAISWDRDASGASDPAGERTVRDFRVPARDDLPQLVVSRASHDPAALTDNALAALGGMARFVSPGDVVAVKPNIGWDRAPIHAANTNPQVVAAVVRAALQAGASRVVVTDMSCNDAERSFQRSGIWKAAHEAGAEVLLPADHRFRTLRMRGVVLDEWPVLKPIVDADKVINVPIAKHHGLARLTCAMKNWYGIIGGRRNRLHQDIDTSIADLATFLRPTLTVIDATRVLMRNGPTGGNIDDTREQNVVVATLDEVAGDSYACRFIDERPERVGYLRIAHERGIGTMDLDRVRIVEV